ncbi:MAG: OmpA family protein [Bacteroidales bacterium]|nr:OmpA family protein [Bacteroidales bacterium]MCF8404382.1 OmpA family protein [Bacteroidales bacterium]
MKNLKLILIIPLVYITSMLSAQDIKGSKDHSLITRYPGSVIDYYEVQDYKPYSVATGPQTGYNHIEDWIETEGKFTRIYYTVMGQTTLTEVYRNYLSALKKGGFTILADGIHPESGVSKEVGGRGFLKTFYAKNPAPTNSGIKILVGSSTSAGACYIAAQLQKPGSNVYIVIGGSQYATNEKVFLVDIIEETIMEDDLIQVNADQMLKGIKADGKIALYGIYFDFDKSDIKPESGATLEEVSLLLKNNPEMEVYVVGHTDSKGLTDYNLTLSEKRADAVVKELVEKYGIQSKRLSGHGVGPLCPVSSNDTEAGRKWNRRVELVLR